ncbi:Uncharacterized protein HZ326_12957 [Fusarium oxysporum f. sp. albedinis]|nr:Uncharacterized protein HZ326_12957 [Fusarium oxysporum f. sp. albedinis]
MNQLSTEEGGNRMLLPAACVCTLPSVFVPVWCACTLPTSHSALSSPPDRYCTSPLQDAISSSSADVAVNHSSAALSTSNGTSLAGNALPSTSLLKPTTSLTANPRNGPSRKGKIFDKFSNYKSRYPDDRTVVAEEFLAWFHGLAGVPKRLQSVDSSTVSMARRTWVCMMNEAELAHDCKTKEHVHLIRERIYMLDLFHQYEAEYNRQHQETVKNSLNPKRIKILKTAYVQGKPRLWRVWSEKFSNLDLLRC